MSIPDAKVIVNPVAGNFSALNKWPWIDKKLRDIGLKYNYEFTEEKGHAIELAKTAIDNGCQYLIAVGGDGTISEVTNGIINSNNAHNVILGIINAGTMCAFSRSAGIHPDINNSVPILTGHGRRMIDVGAVDYINNGQSLRRIFINHAEVGFGADVIKAQDRMDKYFTSSIISPILKYIPRVIGGFQALTRYRNKRISVILENETEVPNSLMVVVANGCYIGGNMLIAPQAKIDDGLLDVITAGNIGKIEIWKLWRKTYSGKHIMNPKIRMNTTLNVRIQSSVQVFVEADGEFLGECPASFRILPSALTIVV